MVFDWEDWFSSYTEPGHKCGYVSNEIIGLRIGQRCSMAWYVFVGVAYIEADNIVSQINRISLNL